MRLLLICAFIASNSLVIHADSACSVPKETQKKPAPLRNLITQLADPSHTDAAVKSILELDKNDQGLRTDLAPIVAALVDHCPTGSAWMNAVLLAGDLKLTTSVPSLVRALGRGEIGSGIVAGVSEIQLTNDAVGRSLAHIGDPAIPALSKLLENQNTRTRRRAAIILLNMQSPVSRKVVRNHLASETDPRLKSFLGDLLTSTFPK